MKSLLEISSAGDSITDHADWLELTAVIEADGNAAPEDLARAIIQAGNISEDRARSFAQDALLELQDRIASCDGRGATSRYPFRLDRRKNLLIRKNKTKRVQRTELLYLFLLVVTRADMSATQRQVSGRDPTSIFERIGGEVLRSFWGRQSRYADSRVFGTATRGLGTFRNKIDGLCRDIGEGRGWKPRALSPGAGDGGLDVVAWRRFADDRPGGLIGFAQCKTGVNWRKHRPQLQPRPFCRDYMLQALVLDPWRIFMVPNRIEKERWESDTGYAGLLFDRCRLVQYGQSIAPAIFNDCQVWLDAVLERERRIKKVRT
jgi:hypothetical protein